MAFYDHLRPHQDIGLTIRKCRQDMLIIILILGGIRIHTHHAGRRVHLLQFFLDPLRPGTEAGDVFRPALRTEFRTFLHVTAVMAAQFPVPVLGERNIAMGTFYHKSACSARNKSGDAPSVDKEHRLLAAHHTLGDQACEFPRKETAVPLLQFFPHIHDMYLRKLRPAETLI